MYLSHFLKSETTAIAQSYETKRTFPTTYLIFLDYY